MRQSHAGTAIEETGARRSDTAAPVPATPRFVPLALPSITESEVDEVVATLRSGWLTTGARVAEFERRFAEYAGARHAIAVNSCTAALHLSLLACGIGPGDEVVTTPLTFCATANAIIHTGATPVFADVDRETMNLDPQAASAVITGRTRAILPVHFAGRPVEAAAFRAIATRERLLIVEDAAHAVEAVAAEGKVGATADFTCFSFYATKNLTTGEGGMVTTGSSEWADRIRTASLHGMSQGAWSRYSESGSASYDVTMAGFKYNMMDLQAAIGLHQLARLGRMHARREAIWRRYDEGLADLPLLLPTAVQAGCRHARHLYTVLVDREACGVSRDELQRRLLERRVGTSIHFRALHLHSFYSHRYGLGRGMFPHAEYISDRTLSLPLSAAMTDEDVERVVGALHEVLA
jgi:dTDP-4-amino-4,6-dideoxygalactose transaminase